MRIALLAPLRFPIREPFYGGLEMHTHLLARELLARGHEVTLFAHPDSNRLGDLWPLSVPEGAGNLRLAWAYYRALRAIRRGGFDLVHDNSIHFLPPLASAWLPLPMVTTLHTPPYRSLQYAALWSGFGGRHAYASISHHLHDVWLPYAGPHHVVYNGLDLSDWPFSDSPEPGTAVWYGRFSPEKGAEYAIAAARRAGLRLRLAGPIYDQAYFDQKVAPELDETITYVGHLSQAALSILVGNSAVGLVTSVWDEPFGLVYAEMLACGTPVAAFASGAAEEIITADCGATVPKQDIGALTQVLGKLVKKQRKDCRRRVETAFPVSRMMEEYETLYWSLLGK